MAESQNFYQVLGVEKDADERTIKKAYFTLVRKYPPETHAEEFKRIREAYEVLSNATSRKDYDAVAAYDQYGEEISSRIKQGQAAMDAGDWRTAQQHFAAVLNIQPNLHFARDLLGMAYLNNDEPQKALVEFDRLVATQPDNAVYQLHRGYGHHRQKAYGAAMEAYRNAKALDTTDTRVLVAMADCLTDQKQYEAALVELDAAINMDGEVDFQDFVFFMRKVQIQLLRNRADLAEADLDTIFKILPEDPEARKYVATRLASLAADLFAMKRSVDANRLLQRCKQIDPSRASMEFQFPARSKVPIATLPKTSQDWIIKHGKEFAAGKLAQSAWGGPIFLVIVAGLLVLIALNAGLNTRSLWSPQQTLMMALFLIGAPLLLALGIRRVARVKNSPYGKYTTIHPLHLMQVDIDEVTLWPLVNLHDVALTHHSTNGVYQYTAVRLDFAGTISSHTIRGQQASVDWANRLLAQRRRVLELMSMGLLDAEEGFDLVPPAQLAGAAPKLPEDPLAKKKALTFYGIFAGVGLLTAIIAIPLNRGAAEREAWRSCSYSYAGISDYRRYLQRFPSGKHASDAQAAIDKIYTAAFTEYQAKATDGDPKAVETIKAVLTALKVANTTQVKIEYESSVDFSGLKGVDSKQYGDVIPPDRAFTDTANKARESSITKALSSAFGTVLKSNLFEFDDGGYKYRSSYEPVLPPSPVTFHIKYKIIESGSIYESTTGVKKRMFGILFGWDFAVRIKGENGDHFTINLPSAPQKHISYSTTSYDNSEIRPYQAMAESAFDEFGRKLAGSFGVKIPAPVDTGSYGGSGSGYGKYGGGKYGSGSGSGYNKPLDPAVQKMIDDAIRNASKKKY